MRSLRKAALAEMNQGMGQYLTGLFFFLTGVFSGIVCASRAGLSLGAGANGGVFSALFLSAAPFALMIVCAPFLMGVIGLCGVMLWQGLLFGCAPAFPFGLIEMAVCIPAALYLFKKSLSVSLKWCKIKRATSQMRIAAVSELFAPALACMLACFLSRLPACIFL